MLTQYNIDTMMQDIQAGKDVYIFYVAHMAQTRECRLDEHIYKSVSQFKAIKVKVSDIVNAWFEHSNFKSNPSQYRVETEVELYDEFSTYTHYYTVKNLSSSYKLDINARFPSIIYGVRRSITDRYGEVHDISDPTPVKEYYTNTLVYGDLAGTDITTQYKKGNLNWKYKTLSPAEEVDGISFNYVTSNYYILTLDNYPMIEKPLI